MFRKKFRAEPAIALTVLYAALSLGVRAHVPQHHGLRWSWGQGDRTGLRVGPDEPPKVEKPRDAAAAMAEYDSHLVRAVQLTGVTHYAAGTFDPYLRYLMHRPLAMAAIETVVQVISTHYRVDGHPLPRIFACIDDGRVGNLIIAVFET
jgi:hemolysin activation/secretion protein